MDGPLTVSSGRKGGSSSTIRFTAISGARQEGAPACYLLEVDETRILLDSGTTPSLDVAHLQALKRHLGRHRLDAILLSHGTLQYLGGLPFVLGLVLEQEPLPCILGTLPVHHLGMVALYEAYESAVQVGAPPVGTSLDLVDRAFEHMVQLRYAQTFLLPGSALAIQAQPSGHTVGGTVWRVRAGDDTIVYAPAFNHKREAHLDGAPFELLARPTLLLTGAGQALTPSVPRKTRDEALLGAVGEALKAGGTVLLPVEDAGGRTLELLQVLAQHWASGRRQEPIVLLAHQARRTLDLARGMLEWMGVGMMRGFEADRKNPFELKAVLPCHSLAELAAIKEPRLVLASGGPDLEAGLARALLPTIAASSRALLLFPTIPRPGTFGHRLWESKEKSPRLALRIVERVPLEGEELRAHRRAAQEAKERAAADAAFAELQRRRHAEEAALQFDEDGEDEAMEEEDAPPRQIVTEAERINSARLLKEMYWTEHRWDCHVEAVGEDGSRLDWPLLGSKRPPGFPLQLHRHIRPRTTDYGIAVDPALFQQQEEPEEPSRRDQRQKDRTEAPKKEAPAKAAEPEEVPTKLIDYVKEIGFRLKRQYLDFAGLTDGRSLRTILGQLEPRRLLLLGGPDAPTDYLHALFAFSSAVEGSEAVAVSPPLHETVRFALDSSTRQAVLGQDIIDQLETTVYRDLELAHVRARVRFSKLDEGDGEGTRVAEMQVDEQAERDETPLLYAPEEGLYAAYRRPLLIGDIRLNELRSTILTKHSLPAEFVAGDLLLADGRLRLRREDDGRQLVLEGAATESYYKVRDLLYSQLAIV